MPNLTQLFLSDNQLRGPIPADWSTSPLLSSFILSNNMLTGTIPRPVPANLYSIYSALPSAMHSYACNDAAQAGDMYSIAVTIGSCM